jgi:hypothetical protein
MRCWFSALKYSRNWGGRSLEPFDGAVVLVDEDGGGGGLAQRYAHGSGEEAISLRVVHVRRGVRWMKGAIFAWASRTLAGVRGGQLEVSAMLTVS